jgi:hypothetical protein
MRLGNINKYLLKIIEENRDTDSQLDAAIQEQKEVNNLIDNLAKLIPLNK